MLGICFLIISAFFGYESPTKRQKKSPRKTHEARWHLPKAPSSHSRTSPWEGSIILLLSFTPPLLCLSLARTQKRRNRHRRYGRMRAFHEPRHDGSSILAFRSSWQVHGSMPPWPRNPHRACALLVPSPSTTVRGHAATGFCYGPVQFRACTSSLNRQNRGACIAFA